MLIWDRIRFVHVWCFCARGSRASDVAGFTTEFEKNKQQQLRGNKQVCVTWIAGRSWKLSFLDMLGCVCKTVICRQGDCLQSSTLFPFEWFHSLSKCLCLERKKFRVVSRHSQAAPCVKALRHLQQEDILPWELLAVKVRHLFASKPSSS